MSNCVICFQPSQKSKTCSVACRDTQAADRAVWASIAKYAIADGWVPSLNSYASPACPDPSGRYRIAYGVLFEHRGPDWHRIGLTGFRLGDLPPLIYPEDQAPVHAPWPDGMFRETVLLPELVTPEMAQQYVHAIRRNRSSDLDAMLRRDIGPIPGGYSIAKLYEINSSPMLASWAGFSPLP